MDRMQEVKEMARNYKAEAIDRVGELENGLPYEFVQEDDFLVLNLDGEQFKISGNKHLRVEQTKVKKVRSKGPKAEYFEAVCSKCGKKFQLSKFNPYHTVCYDCRKADRAESGRWMDGDRIEVVCRVTGKKFKTSKFTPYVDVSPEGRKILKAREEEANAAGDKQYAIDMETLELVEI